MKVIDLLNKIANGEEVPKKIQVYQDIFVLDNSNKIYETEMTRINLLSIYNGNILNYEVRIIEDKKIEKLESYISCGWNGTCKDLKRNDLFNDLKKIGNKINEIIDYLEENK